MANQSQQRRCSALFEGTGTRCQSWTSDRSNDFCPRHKEERWRLVRAYKEAGERATTSKPTAVTTKEELYALYSADQVTAAVAKTTVYLEELREELNGRTAVSERFYTNGAPDGHHVRIRNLQNEEAVVAALLRDLELRARTMSTRVPRQPLRPVAVNRRAPVQRDYEYGNRDHTPVNYGRRPYRYPAGNGGMPGCPESSLGDGLLRLIVYAMIGYGTYKVANFMLLEAIQVCRRIMAPFRELARKGVVEYFGSARESLSQLAAKGVEAASHMVAPSANNPEQGVKNAVEGLTEVGSWILGRWAAIQAPVSKLVEDGVKAAGDAVTSSGLSNPGEGMKNVERGLTEARGWIVERSGPMWKSLSQLAEDGAKAASEAVASAVGGQVKK